MAAYRAGWAATSEILEVWADDGAFIAADAGCHRTDQGKTTRRSKIRYLLNRKAPSAEFVGLDPECLLDENGERARAAAKIEDALAVLRSDLLYQ